MIKLKTNKNYTKSSIKEIIIYQNKDQIGKNNNISQIEIEG
jgi:hypothetical protein